MCTSTLTYQLPSSNTKFSLSFTLPQRSPSCPTAKEIYHYLEYIYYSANFLHVGNLSKPMLYRCPLYSILESITTCWVILLSKALFSFLLHCEFYSLLLVSSLIHCTSYFCDHPLKNNGHHRSFFIALIIDRGSRQDSAIIC